MLGWNILLWGDPDYEVTLAAEQARRDQIDAERKTKLYQAWSESRQAKAMVEAARAAYGVTDFQAMEIEAKAAKALDDAYKNYRKTIKALKPAAKRGLFG